MTTTGLSCSACGTQLPQDSLFCNKCGTPVTPVTRSAEYKQVTVLFADVVHSMDIAKVVGAERLREIMAGLLDRATEVVGRYGGTVDKFTGDGVMAVFGAPVALEDHAVRACRAALDIQTAMSDLADQVRQQDGVQLQLRIGLNSGQVIAGDIGSNGAGYTAIGEQVGMAQRMESVAPPHGVMLSASTARLVETVARLGDPEPVHIKGAEQPVVARGLLGLSEPDPVGATAVSPLVGRRWEMGAVEGLLQRAMEGHGAVVTVVGSPGIGKSRLVREVAGLAAAQGIAVSAAHCESHTTQVPFHTVARLLRAATDIDHLDPEQARMRLRELDPEADPDDVLHFEDLVGVSDPEAELPKIDPDARRRRLTALVNTFSLTRESPAVYVIEDAHWIDEVSESMLADFFSVIPQTPSLVLVTYRPEYRGLLSQVQDAQTIALTPLSNSETTTLVEELVGSDTSVAGLATLIVERAAGNPFFAHEIVRDLAERGVLQGQAGGYVSTADVAEVSLPATVQATIAARIDRLDPAAKRTLSAAAVIGTKLSRDLLESLGIDVALEDLVRGQFLDQITFTKQHEYVFHHPLIRTVAYESQLKSDRSDLHRGLAATIEARNPSTVDENAALIAEHLEAAGDLHAAYGWHMRAGNWLTHRDLAAARASWQRAGQVADRLPHEDGERPAMRIEPRTMLCGTAWMVGGSLADTGFDELRDLAEASGDKVSLAMGMAGWVSALIVHARFVEASVLGSELTGLLESINDPTLTIALVYAPLAAKLQTGELAETLRLAQLTIDLAEGDPVRGNVIVGSPLTGAIMLRGCVRYYSGDPRWRDDIAQSSMMIRAFDARLRAILLQFKYNLITSSDLEPIDAVAEAESVELLHLAERSGDDFTLACARFVRGQVLTARNPGDAEGLSLLTTAREAAIEERFTLAAAWLVDTHLAEEKIRTDDLDGAIELARVVLTNGFRSGGRIYIIRPTAVLVQALLRRGAPGDLYEAENAVDRLAEGLGDHGLLLGEVWLLRLRALLAEARGDIVTYQDYRDRYRKMVTDFSFGGHIRWAGEMR